ncbi:hypothetical protein [Oleidesulfovibrio alaskensis]|jgi:hypothetical protein|uniref:hypothetical protein n=1 Tax=Oleidesulfovibrio alaskensis TaxID=58180 RepID=UPI001A3FBD1B|nr:hypothetical protein [Oleidesulfovibrio alaskensis]MBL3582613.1 hypothetical protein [Oleidesulfovibrio alaskensis]
MSIWTLEELNGLIEEWKQALKAVASGRSYSIGGQSVSHYSLSDIQQQLSYLEGERSKLLAEQSGKPRRSGPIAVRPIIGRG